MLACGHRPCDQQPRRLGQVVQRLVWASVEQVGEQPHIEPHAHGGLCSGRQRADVSAPSSYGVAVQVVVDDLQFSPDDAGVVGCPRVFVP